MSAVVCDSVAVLLIGPSVAVLETRTVIVALALAPFAKLPTAHVMVPELLVMEPVPVDELT